MRVLKIFYKKSKNWIIAYDVQYKKGIIMAQNAWTHITLSV